MQRNFPAYPLPLQPTELQKILLLGDRDLQEQHYEGVQFQEAKQSQ